MHTQLLRDCFQALRPLLSPVQEQSQYCRTPHTKSSTSSNRTNVGRARAQLARALAEVSLVVVQRIEVKAACMHFRY